ncbi:helix-turn-helix transcriptional regulator [Paenibacillus tarimensis]|uniref:helix-turn-helix transcriptional regulator n=1 Tax=Paenibacillus tarimensis TaxID=416012 RepID=UPI001F1ABC80|nr:AraC family transcriptional regulator [Paenibacillus tarimensis]MCF2942740.1 AraC family transcriptional regulator [Paenibacillus tarimensis]
MKFPVIPKRFNTIFFRLLFSYAALIALTTLFMGTASYMYFTDNFNREVERVHNRMLSNVQHTVEQQVFRKVQSTYIELSSNYRNKNDVLLFFQQPVTENNAKISEAYQHLKYIVNSSGGLLDSVAVYYRKNRMMISSLEGYKSYSNTSDWKQLDWLDRQPFGGSNFLWSDHVPAEIAGPTTSTVFTFAAAYPYVHDDSNSGYILFNVNKKAVARILQSPDRRIDDGRLAIIGPGGLLISNDPEDEKMLAQAVRPENMTSVNRGSGIISVGEDAHMLSYRHLPSANGWTVASLTPVEQFYAKSRTIQQVLLVIGFIAILLGAVVSNIFTSRIYHPLRTLMERTKHLFQDSASARRDVDEYVQINSLIDNLSVKVTQLEKTLDANMPLVKHSLVTGLLQNTIKNREELGDRLHMLGLSAQSYTAGFKISLDNHTMASMTTENAQFIMYHLIDMLESGNENERFVLAVETYGQTISGIAFSSRTEEDAIIKRFTHLQSYAYANFRLKLTGALGEWQENPLETQLSYKQAEAYMQYRFLKPDVDWFHGGHWKLREADESLLEGKWGSAWQKALKAGDEAEAAAILHTVVDKLTSGPYSAGYAYQTAADLQHTFRQCMQDLNIDPGELDVQDSGSMEDFPSIREYALWQLAALSSLSAIRKERSGSRSQDIIDRIKRYVSDNLDGDLSLNAVADHVSLSPAYISKIFKSATGENFVEYVTQERLLRARELIQTTESTIEQIANRVGYYNPAYFTKKFKQAFGMTPSDFRLNLHSREMA